MPKGRGYTIHVQAPQSPIEGSLEDRACAINREIEELISRCPEQYLWSYNRYKVPAGVQKPKENSCSHA